LPASASRRRRAGSKVSVTGRSPDRGLAAGAFIISPACANAPPTVAVRRRLFSATHCYGATMTIAPRRAISAHRPARGFTLIEIMVVITILGILAALIVPRVVGRTDDARIAAAKQDIASLMQALKLYRLDNGAYPTTEQGLRSLLTKPTIEPLPQNWKQGGYLERSTTPKDPWGNEYKYLNPGLKGEIDVFSYGRDGAVGGEEVDADIGSWQL
jgi:general secretion pathway protein G